MKTFSKLNMGWFGFPKYQWRGFAIGLFLTSLMIAIASFLNLTNFNQTTGQFFSFVIMLLGMTIYFLNDL